MSEQLNIHGEPDQPLTWDGEPLYCPDTVREGLFDAAAFEQMPGQTAWTLAICPCCRQDFYAAASDVYCPRCES